MLPASRFRPTVRTVAALAVAATVALGACNSNSSPAGGAGGANAVSIVDFSFNPATLTVTKGSTVTWTNNGSTAHTVTADDGTFDSGNVSAGQTFSQTFASDGTFTYHCKIHSQMKATITVTG